MNEQEVKIKEVISIDSRYERGALIGRGGSGSVYEGLQLGMNRKVAIKILNQRTNSDSFHGRFEREARAVARLNHRNCITIYDNGYDSVLDCHYMVMEFVQGETLDAHIQRGLNVEEILNFSMQILSGIQHAHEEGILHRDIKPSNVLISDKGVAKVLDFGLALTNEDLDTERITRDGAIYGSPPYMSPEQCRGELTIDARSDLYSFGAMLYEMLEGELPFGSTNVLQMLLSHTSEIPPRVTSPDVPSELSDYVDCLLSKDPDDRFESTSAALDTLQGISAAHALRLSRETPLRSNALEIMKTWEDFELPVSVSQPAQTKSPTKLIWLFTLPIAVAVIASFYFFQPAPPKQSKTSPASSVLALSSPASSKITINASENAVADLTVVEASVRIQEALSRSRLLKSEKPPLARLAAKTPPPTRAKKTKGKPKTTDAHKVVSEIKKEDEAPLKTINFEF